VTTVSNDFGPAKVRSVIAGTPRAGGSAASEHRVCVAWAPDVRGRRMAGWRRTSDCFRPSGPVSGRCAAI